MASRRNEGHALLWVGMALAGVFLALLLLGGGVAALWALGYLGPRRDPEAAGGKPSFTVPTPAGNGAAPFLPAGNPFANAGRGRLTAANCDKLKPGMTEAEVRALLGPPLSALQLSDVRGAGGLAERMVDTWPAKGITYAEGGEVVLWVYFNAAGRVVGALGTVEGKAVAVMVPPKDPFDNLRPGQMPNPFDRFPANPFLPGGMPPPGAPGGGMPAPPANPFAPAGPPAPAPPVLTRALYDRVQNGMSDAEVIAVLGQPTSKLGPQLNALGIQSTDSWQWSAGRASVKVHFRADRVFGKEAYNLP
jgi:hypothetical protein